jgi:succinate dehydrogenase / fumarate reductase iron-sulfur subunit
MLVKLKIWRSVPTGDGVVERRLQDYEVDVPGHATLLDTLDAIKHEQDGSLSYRKSCRMAICGSCGMRMDGRAVLACKIRMKPIAEKGAVPVLAPMGNMKVIKDLVTDMGDFWNKIRATTPWLEHPERPMPADGREFLVSPEEQAKITRESLCIMCGCCVSECNSMEADPAFMGPAALAKGYRFVGDVRDTKTRERLEVLDGEHGVWDCTRCYFCNERCPKGVEPRDAIAKLGAALFDHGMTGDKGARHAQVFIDSAKGQGTGITAPLPLYNGHLSETALVPLTLGPEFLKPSWQTFGIKLFARGKAPAPWHAMLHKQGKLDEVQRLWRILEQEESAERRGGDLDEPARELPPNVAKSVRKTMTPEELYERTGAIMTAENTEKGSDPLDLVDLSTYGERYAQYANPKGGKGGAVAQSDVPVPASKD